MARRPVLVVALVAAAVLVPVASSAASASSAAAGSDADGVGALHGRVVVLDPGHDGGNGAAPAAIGRPVPDGRGGTKACDTAGASTDDGYPEHAFSWDVALRAAALLRARGADVVLTRRDDRGIGPCVDRRAAIGNAVHADAVVSLHADGGPPAGRGFHVILPVSGPQVRSSHHLALALRAAFGRDTDTRVADYTAGGDGLDGRDDLAGLALSQVPKVFLECANMRDAADAQLLRNPAWRQRAALGVADGITVALRR